MLLLVYTVVSAQQAGWGSARTIGSFAGVAVLLGVFTFALSYIISSIIQARKRRSSSA